MRVWVGGHNVPGKRLALNLLANTVRPTSGVLDLAVIAPESPDEAAYFARKLKTRLTAQGVIWVLYPRNESSDGASFSDYCAQVLRLMASEGLVDCGEAAIDAHYTSAGYRLTKRTQRA